MRVLCKNKRQEYYLPDLGQMHVSNKNIRLKPKAKPVEAKRARTESGRYKADDKSTPDINEAWVGGKKPTKKAKKR